MQEPNYVREARLAQQRSDHNNPVQLEIGGLMPPLQPKDLLDDLEEKIRRSDDTTEAAIRIASWISVAGLRIKYQTERINQLERKLNDVIEHHGLSTGY